MADKPPHRPSKPSVIFTALAVPTSRTKIKIPNIMQRIANILTIDAISSGPPFDFFDVDKIDIFGELLSRMSYSNSTEVYNFRGAIASQLVNLDDPIQSFNKIENIFKKSPRFFRYSR